MRWLWAKKRFLPRAAGHAKGAAQVKRIIEACAERDVRYVTLYAFSTENWARPSDEVSALMSLFLFVRSVVLCKSELDSNKLIKSVIPSFPNSDLRSGFCGTGKSL